MVRVTLDAETFKALASPTRLGVLRALDERRKTLTEISRDLNLNKATVHEHLALLAAADLVRKRDDEGRKWIYYELTWRGQKLLHPQETTTFNVLLGLGVAAAGGGLGLLANSLYNALEPHVASAPFFSPESPSPKSATDTNGAGTAPTTAASTGTATATGTGSSSSAAPQGGAPATSTASSTSTTAVHPGAGAPAAAIPQSPTTTAAPVAANPVPHPNWLNDDGTLGLALLAFAVLMALLAWLLRRHLRADPFRPPPGPPEPKSQQ